MPDAVEEMRYAAAPCQRALKKAPTGGPIDQRRRELARRVLAKCG